MMVLLTGITHSSKTIDILQFHLSELFGLLFSLIVSPSDSKVNIPNGLIIIYHSNL